MSSFENLPIELVQRIASYLMHDDIREELNVSATCNKLAVIFDGLLELRASSRILKIKVEYLFLQCFEVKAVGFSFANLIRFLQFSQDETYVRLIKHLVFVKRHDPVEDVTHEMLEYVHEHGARNLHTANLIGTIPDATSTLVMIYDNLVNVSKISISSTLAGLHAAHHRSRSLTHHPRTIILSATIIAKKSLEHLHMRSTGYGLYHGIRPRVSYTSFGYMAEPRILRSLKVLLSAQKGCLTKSLTHVSYLDHLSLSIDNATIVDFAPHLNSGGLALFSRMSVLRFEQLASLHLSWMEATYGHLVKFLDRNCSRLHTLKLDNFHLVTGMTGWTPVLWHLQYFRSLRSLQLNQLGTGTKRCTFRNPDCPSDRCSTELGHKCVRAQIEVIDSNSWARSMQDIADRVVVLRTPFDPNAPDALEWEDF